MSAGQTRIPGGLFIQESTMDVPTEDGVGLRVSGGILQTAKKGAAAWSTLGVGASYVTTLLAPATQIDVTGLVPAADGDYDLYSVVQVAQANVTLTHQPNGANTNATSLTGNLLNGAVVRADMALARVGLSPYTFASGSVVVMDGRIIAKVGRIRGVRISWTVLVAGAVADAGSVNGIFNDSSTALASWTVLSGVASGLGTGSFVRLTGVPQSA